MSQLILVINAGSSSLKFSVFDWQTRKLVLSALAEKLAQTDATLSIKQGASKKQRIIARAEHQQMIECFLQILPEYSILLSQLVAVGHRVVHGGEFFSDSVVINQQVIEKIVQCSTLAPLHNPANLLGINCMSALLPDVQQVAVFDTAFHQSLDKKAYLYPIDYSLYQQHKIRRYGFHGTSFRYVSAQAATYLPLPADDQQMLIVHLGNGCSACALKNGQSVDTTMGLTPLEGLMMGTRSGDVDPGLHAYLAESLSWSIQKINSMLNKQSGLLGISGSSNDMRKLIELSDNGDQQATLAIEMFCFRISKQVAALSVSLTRIDALVFTGGIGENSPLIRSKVINALSLLGFKLDKQKNTQAAAAINVISQANTPALLVVNTNEEWQIAQDCIDLVQI